MMWLSATKGGTMKDTKPKVMPITKNIRATLYQDGEFDLCFHAKGRRKWIFEFSKFKRIKCGIIIDGLEKRPNTDEYKNWKDFRYMVNLCGKEQEIPAWIKALTVWRFDKPLQTRMVEDRIGCVVFFREEKY